MTDKQIPFTQEDRRTIRATAMWMLVAGGLMVLVGGYTALQAVHLLSLFTLPLDTIWMFVWAPVLQIGGQLGLGILLLIGGNAFMGVARRGEIAALTRGLSMLTVIYVVQAIMMLLIIAAVMLIWMLPLFLQ